MELVFFIIEHLSWWGWLHAYTDLLDLNTKVVMLQTLKMLKFLNLLCFNSFSNCFFKAPQILSASSATKESVCVMKFWRLTLHTGAEECRFCYCHTAAALGRCSVTQVIGSCLSPSHQCVTEAAGAPCDLCKGWALEQGWPRTVSFPQERGSEPRAAVAAPGQLWQHGERRGCVGKHSLRALTWGCDAGASGTYALN